jgi:adenylate kinase
MRQILLRGLPGSGKSTLAKRLRETCNNVAYLSSGSLLREYFANRPSEASRGMDRGQLAESDLVIRLMHSAFTKLDDASTSVLIDGFPRKVSELNRWTELTSHPDFVIICECDEDVRMRRLLGRRICKSCGAGYNMHEDSGLPVIKTRVVGFMLGHPERDETMDNRL